MANEQNSGQMQGGMGGDSSGDYGNGSMPRFMQGGSAMRSSRMMQGGMEGDSMQGGEGVRDAVAQEAVSFPTPGKPPHMDGTFDMLNVRPADIDLLAGEIRTAQTELDNAAALAKANAPAPEGGAA